MSEKMKVLIAYDGLSCTNAALDDLQRAGLPCVAEALIMSVADVFLPPPSSSAPAFPAQVPAAIQRAWAQATHAVEEARALAQQARTRLLMSFPAWDVRAGACADSPAWAVIKKAATWQPDVIVVGSHGRSAMSRLWLGSVSHTILTEAEHWGADCIFVEARGLSRIERFLLGSVSAAVAMRAHCSLEVVRPAVS